MARREYSNETKAAVMAALLAGQAVGEIAEQYDIPASTIKSWKSRQKNGESVAIVATEKKVEIGDRLMAYLDTTLTSMEIQAKHFGDTSWLTNQDADQLAVLHGVQTDKAIRLLELLVGAEEESDNTG